MKDTIAQMLKVEAEAKDIVAAAEADAQEIVYRARLESAAVQDAARRDAQAEAARRVEQGIEDARRRRRDMLAAIDKGTEALRQIAPDKADAARQMIRAELTGRASGPGVRPGGQ